MGSRSIKRKRTEEEEEETLISDYERIMSKPVNVEFASNYIFDSLVLDIITNVSFRAHFEAKHVSKPPKNEKELNLTDTETEIEHKLVNCLNCNKVVAAVKFASHLGEF